jgi:hypothetical protein
VRLLGFTLLGAFCLMAAAEKLEIEKFALRQFEDGPALPASHEFLPGETIFWSFRMRGYKIKKSETETGDQESHMKLTWTLLATDPKGVAIDKERSGHVEARLFDQDKDWTPRAADSFVVPPFAPSGIYHATVTVKDDSDRPRPAFSAQRKRSEADGESNVSSGRHAVGPIRYYRLQIRREK